MVARLFAPQFLVLYWFAITAMIVHFRGRDRLTFTRQLTDHSTLLAPYNVLMYWFSALPNRPVLPSTSHSATGQAARELGNHPRRSLGAVRAGRHQGRRQVQRFRLQFVLPHRLEAVLSQMVRRAAAVGEIGLPAHRRVARTRSPASRAPCSPRCRPAADSCGTATPMPDRCAIISAW